MMRFSIKLLKKKSSELDETEKLEKFEEEAIEV